MIVLNEVYDSKNDKNNEAPVLMETESEQIKAIIGQARQQLLLNPDLRGQNDELDKIEREYMDGVLTIDQIKEKISALIATLTQH